MRTIKFRAWDTKKQMMTGLPFAIVSQSDNYLLVKDYSTNGFWVPEKTSRLIPMQFTGLLDKKGKEIWEGDIVYDGDYLSLVSWAEGGFCLQHQKSRIKYPMQILTKENHKLEVIGNIYENPELLKGTYG